VELSCGLIQRFGRPPPDTRARSTHQSRILRSICMSQVGLVALRPEERGTHFLLPECLVFRDGASAPVELGAKRGKLLVITLEIHRVTEYDGLLVSVWGSADKSDWGTTPLLTFPTKSYCGVYSALLNLANNTDLEYLRVHWHLRHWGRGE